MMQFNSEKELLDYLVKRMKEEKTLETCKKCFEEDGRSCCTTFQPNGGKGPCKFLSDKGCTNRNVQCSLAICSKLQFHHPELAEEFENIKKSVIYVSSIKYPMEVKK